MPTRIGTHEVKTHLSEYLNRVAYAGERVLVERHGKPVAALVRVDDLRRLETMDAEQPDSREDAAREDRFRRQLEEAGAVVKWHKGPAIRPAQRRPLLLDGQPISVQIIDDRR